MNSSILISYPDADVDEIQQFQNHFTRLSKFSEFKFHTGVAKSEAEFMDRIGNAQGLLLGWGIPGSVMEKAPNLEVISFTGIGVDKFIDMPTARKRGITVCNCPGYSNVTVAEHAMSLLLSLVRQIPEMDHKLKKGVWDQPTNFRELNGKKIGLIGFGGIAKYFAKLCNAFGMEVMVWNRTRSREMEEQFTVKFCELDELYQSCEIISLHLGSNDKTNGILDADAFEDMKTGTLLINTARAELVDEVALINALDTGKLAGAGLDVFHQEPLPETHPLTNMNNVIMTPHVAYNTPEAVDRLFAIAVNNLESYFQGNKINVVD